MMQLRQQPPANPVNTPAPVTPVAPAKKEPTKVFGMDLRNLAAVLGLTLFFVVAMAGVLIALRQRSTGTQSVVPTAPSSKPKAAENDANSCTLVFLVEGPSPTPGVSPSPTPSISPSPTPSVSPSPSPTPITYSCNSSCTSDANCQDVNADYRCVTTTDGNRCRLGTNTASASCEPLANTYACNSLCSSNTNCQTASSSYVCVTTSTGDRCRLDTYTSAENCQPPVTPSPTPTPQPGCNERCVSNGDCRNSAHICYNSVCRLESYPDSTTCTVPVTTTTTTPVTVSTTQPELPPELPRTGTFDETLAKFIGPGIGILILGALALLVI